MLDISRYAQALRETRRMTGLNGRYGDQTGGRETPYTQRWQNNPFQGTAGMAGRESGFTGANRPFQGVSRPVPVAPGTPEATATQGSGDILLAQQIAARKLAEQRQLEAQRLQFASGYGSSLGSSIGTLRAPTGFRAFR